MKQSFTVFTTTFFLVFNFACNYEPEGINPVEVALPTPEDINFTLTIDNALDTLYVYDVDQRITFAFTQPDVEEIRFLLNGKEVGISPYYQEDQQGAFNIHGSGLSDGTYPLEAVVVVKAETNSLAGTYGTELVELHYQWTLILDTAPVPLTKITSIEPHEGSLRVQWDPYLKRDFVSYQVSRYSYWYTDYQVATITDPTITKYVDSTYIGGPATYQVSVTYRDFRNLYEYTREGEARDFADSLLTFYPTQTTNDITTLSWSKSRYYTNFKYYSIYQTKRNEYYGHLEYKTLIATLSDVNDTVYTLTIPFGQSTTYQLFVNQDDENYNIDPLAETEAVFVGRQTERFTNLLHRPNAQSVYLTNESSIYRMNERSDQIDSELPSGGNVQSFFVVSNDASVAYCHQGPNILSVDPTDLSLISSIPLNGLVQGNLWMRTNAWLGNNNHLFVEVDPNSFGQTIEVLDMRVSQPHSRHYFPGLTESFVLSPRGNFFARNRTVYVLTENDKREIGTFSTLGDYTLLNHPSDNDKFLVIDHQRVRTFTWLDATMVTSVDLKYSLQHPTIDATTGYLGGLRTDNPTQYVLYNTTTGELVRQIHVVDPDNYGSHPLITYYFHHSTLFSDQGYYLPLTF